MGASCRHGFGAPRYAAFSRTRQLAEGDWWQRRACDGAAERCDHPRCGQAVCTQAGAAAGQQVSRSLPVGGCAVRPRRADLPGLSPKGARKHGGRCVFAKSPTRLSDSSSRNLEPGRKGNSARRVHAAKPISTDAADKPAESRSRSCQCFRSPGLKEEQRLLISRRIWRSWLDQRQSSARVKVDWNRVADCPRKPLLRTRNEAK